MPWRENKGVANLNGIYTDFIELLRKKYFRDLQIISLTKSLTKISAKNAQQYVAFGEDLYWDRLTARNLNENLKKN